MPDPSECKVIEVLDVRLDFVSTDKTGLVRGGSLMLRGKVRDISYRQSAEARDKKIISVNGVELMRQRNN